VRISLKHIWKPYTLKVFGYKTAYRHKKSPPVIGGD
jgi:hypothetical protein